MCSIRGLIQLHVEFTIFLLFTAWHLLHSTFPAETWIHWICDPLMEICTFSIVYVDFSDFAPAYF